MTYDNWSIVVSSLAFLPALITNGTSSDGLTYALTHDSQIVQVARCLILQQNQRLGRNYSKLICCIQAAFRIPDLFLCYVKTLFLSTSLLSHTGPSSLCKTYHLI